MLTQTADIPPGDVLVVVRSKLVHGYDLSARP
jgi:hypothetical protein